MSNKKNKKPRKVLQKQKIPYLNISIIKLASAGFFFTLQAKKRESFRKKAGLLAHHLRPAASAFALGIGASLAATLLRTLFTQIIRFTVDHALLGETDGLPAFLLDAPAMFSRLGDQLGAIQHIVSYWRFRFAPGAAQVQVEELIDIFMDFETGLLGRDEFAETSRFMAA